MTASGKTASGGGTTHSTSPALAKRRASDEARVVDAAQKALRLKIEGASYRAIGQAIGTSDVTAMKYVHRALAEIQESNEELAHQYRELEARRLEQQRLHIAPLLAKPDLRAHEVAIRLSERKARLLGLDVRGPDGVMPVEQVVALLRGVTALFLELVEDRELRQRFVFGLRRQAGPFVGRTIDVPAEPAPEGEPDEERREG